MGVLGSETNGTFVVAIIEAVVSRTEVRNIVARCRYNSRDTKRVTRTLEDIY